MRLLGPEVDAGIPVVGCVGLAVTGGSVDICVKGGGTDDDTLDGMACGEMESVDAHDHKSSRFG